jgi:hypothetical protein
VATKEPPNLEEMGRAKQERKSLDGNNACIGGGIPGDRPPGRGSGAPGLRVGADSRPTARSIDAGGRARPALATPRQAPIGLRTLGDN